MDADATAPTPRVRVIVVAYNAADYLVRCFEHLVATDWPPDALDLVLVDNGSSDDGADLVAEKFPQVRIIRSRENLGFAGGNNLALDDLAGVNYVGLVNPDAFVEPGWLRPLVDAVSAGERVGAANPKVLLDPRYVTVDLETEPFRPGAGDPRTLGVRVGAVEVDGADRWSATLFQRGFFDVEADANHEHFRWSEDRATVWVPLPPDPVPPMSVRLQLQADREKEVTLRVGERTTTATVSPSPDWVAIEADDDLFDVINSAGNTLQGGGYGVDRGFGERDGGPWNEPSEVFAWTGAAVLLDTGYLADVGLFDETFFLYSEDLDLSWRGRLRGWSYRYVPDSVVRHVHGGVIGRRSPVADHYSQRNAVLTLVKNAPGRMWRHELRRYAGDLVRMLRAEVVQPLRRRSRPRLFFARRRARVLLAVLARLPRALAQRRRIGRRATVSRDAVVEPWL